MLDDIPAFVRDPAVLPELAVMGLESDRSSPSSGPHRAASRYGRRARPAIQSPH